MKLGSSIVNRGPICLAPPSVSSRKLLRRHKVVSVSAQLVHPSSSVSQRSVEREAILLQRFRGHTAAVTALLVTGDGEGRKEFISSSLDKTLALWNLEASAEHCGEIVAIDETVRLHAKEGPAFSLAADIPSIDSVRRQIFCGTAAKCVSTWELPDDSFQEKVVLNGHTGWVRALATDGRWLFSSGCNHISQWDLARSVPRKVNELSTYTGDIQGLATGGGRMFSSGSDGSIRSWNVGKKGELSPAAAREKAHKERVSAILYKNGFLYSVSLDGSVKMWDASTLELVMCCSGAHDGGKVHCATIGPDGNVYTGGEDKMVRRWQLGSLMPSKSVIYCHNFAVRALAAGALETLVSADSYGEIAVWKV